MLGVGGGGVGGGGFGIGASVVGGCGGGGGPLFPSSPFDFILVLDFEATCDDPEEITDPEIIEFPVVCIESATALVVAEFHSFVRPTRNRRLTPFCTQLTGITQVMVDNAPVLSDVIAEFEEWYRRTLPPGSRAIFATDGPWDMRDFMYRHSVCSQGIAFPPLFYQWIDVKEAFANFFSCGRCKIRAMLEVLGMQFQGQVHSGIDDARNIARIVIALMTRGCNFVHSSHAIDWVEKRHLMGPTAGVGSVGTPTSASFGNSMKGASPT